MKKQISQRLKLLKIKSGKIKLYWGGMCTPSLGLGIIVPANTSASITYNIPWDFRLSSHLSVFHQFAIIPQIHENDRAALTMSAKKGNANSQHQLSDATTPCILQDPCN